MRVVVNTKSCEANGNCVAVAPEVFDLGDDDVVRLLDERPADVLRPKIAQAVHLCPKSAISIVEDDESSAGVIASMTRVPPTTHGGK